MDQHDWKWQITQAIDALNLGKTVGLPTETVYGLAADALNPLAVAEIFAIKNRPAFDPLIVHLASIDEVPRYARSFPEAAQILAERFWPGPLTLVLPKQDQIPDLVTSGLPYVALRVPAHPLALELLRSYDRPLAAPSANKFGRISPTTAAAVREELGEAVAVILDGGPCRIGLESTILSFAKEQPMLLRAGGIPVEEIEPLTGPLARPTEEQKHLAPGNLPSHYAPRTPWRLLDTTDALPLSQRARKALLGWGQMDTAGFRQTRNLSEAQSFPEAASRLFQFLRELDGSGAEEILALPLPEENLGRAINDRLRRAAHR